MITNEMIEAFYGKVEVQQTGTILNIEDGLAAALALQPREQKQFLPTEDGEFNGNVLIVPPYCSGYAFVFEPGVLHVKNDGSGYLVVNEEDFVLEDDRSEGPDGPEGSVHWIVHLDPSEIVALRNFLNGAPAPLPVAVKEWADALERELKPLDDLPPSIQSQANIRLINSARALIRSILSSPASPQCCMCGKKGLSTVEGDGGPECELSDGRWVCSAECWDKAVELTPTSDIAALREENERLKRALEKIASAPAWGYPERWETTPAEVRQLARSVLNESKKGAEQ